MTVGPFVRLYGGPRTFGVTYRARGRGSLRRDLTNFSQNIIDEQSADGEQNSLPPFEEIVRLYQRDVRLYVMRQLGAGASADDVSQEIFIEVYRSLHRCRSEQSLRAWIFAIARHRILDWFRTEARNRRRKNLDFDSDLIQFRLGQFESQETDQEAVEQQLGALRQCLEQLPTDHRELIDRHYLRGETAEAIAASSGRNSGTIRMALLRVRHVLGKCISQHLGVDQGRSFEQ